jgi:hypothetical protein
MQFLACRNVLSYKWLWLVLNSSVASMKGWLRRETHGKNRAILSFARRSPGARATRAKVLKILPSQRCLFLLFRLIGCSTVRWTTLELSDGFPSRPGAWGDRWVRTIAGLIVGSDWNEFSVFLVKRAEAGCRSDE